MGPENVFQEFKQKNYFKNKSWEKMFEKNVREKCLKNKCK